MKPEPPDYDPRLVHRLRPPETEGSQGDWTSRWLLNVDPAPGDQELADLSTAVNEDESEGVISLVGLGDGTVRLELRSRVHPLDPEAYPLIDRVLERLDDSLSGILEINGSPRDWWRTFRQRRPSSDQNLS